MTIDIGVTAQQRIEDPAAIKGGQVDFTIENDESYKTHTFTSSGELVVEKTTIVDVLVVAGGGGGGSDNGGGGGAGGLIYRNGYSQLTPGTYSVVVGAGGAGAPVAAGTTTGAPGSNGGNSEIAVIPDGYYDTGGSVGFDGATGFLSVTDNPELRIGLQDFTIEAWVYLNNYRLFNPIAAKNGATGPEGWVFATVSTTYLPQKLLSPINTVPSRLEFGSNGEKMYVVENNSVYEYDLYTPENITTANHLPQFSVLAQAATPSGIYFTPDGTGLYVIDSVNDSVHQYAVNTPWSVKSAVYVRSFSVTAQETAPNGVSFKPDGTKMYVVGSTGDDVNEYTLSTPWNISTAVFVQLFFVGTQDSVPEDIFIRDDGLKMYIIGSFNDSVYEYNISTPWNIATASFVRSFSVAAQEITPAAISFKPDGTKMYVVGSTGDDVNEYTLSTAWNISTAVFVQLFSIAAQETTPTAISFKPDGTKMYVLGTTTDTVYEYELTTAWNVSTAVYTIPIISLSAQDSNMLGITFNSDGTKMFAAGNNSQSIYEYNLSTPWNVRTAVYSQSYLTDLSLTTIKFNNTGDKLYVLSELGALVTEYSLENSWDISEVTLSSTYNLFDYEQYPVDIKFKSDGTEFFIVGRSRNITSYSLSAAWDISTATFSDRRDISTYNIPSGLGFSNSGDKLYVLDQLTDTIYQHELSENWDIMSQLGLLGRLYWQFQEFLVFSTARVDLKSWTHVAVTRRQGTLKFFINGNVAGEFADPNDYASASDFRIGRGRGASTDYFNGSISNFRFILEDGIYRNNFTLPSRPLSSTGLTSLLALNSKTGIADTSANNFTITVTGSVTPSSLSPFFSPSQTTKLISYGGGGGNSGQNALAARSGGQAGGSGGGAQGEAPWLNYNVGAAGEALQPVKPGYMSNTFNALSRLVIANNNLFNFDSTIDYTVETWIYLEGDSPLNASNLRRACIMSGVADITGSTNSFEFLVDGTSTETGTGLLLLLRNDSTTLVTYTFPTTIEKFKWHHVAFSKINSTMQVYLNGVRIQLVNDFTMRTSPGPNPIKIGSVFATGTTFQPLIGKLSNLRVSRGIGRYNNSEFSLPTAPFTNDNYTVLLTCQGESFKDASNNQLTVTREGDVRAVSSNTPFVRKKLFSGIFRDNGYLRADFALATFTAASQPWTIECWINPVSQSTVPYFIGINSIAAGGNTLLASTGNILIGTTTYTYSQSFTAGEWAHFAMTYTGTVLKVYKNGQLILNQTLALAALYLSVLGIGAEFDDANGGTPGDYFNGYLHDFRIVKSVVYTDNFISPTTLLEDIPGTTLLLLRGEKIVDESSSNTVVTNFNNIRLENFSPYNDEFVPTTYSSFVPTVDYGSIEFDGSTSYIDAASDFAIGTNDFTIEFWCKFTVNGEDGSTSRRILSQTANLASGVQVYVNGTTVTINGKSNLAGSINLFTNGNVIGTVRRVNDGQWHHIAFTREGTVLRSFVDGQLMDSIANNTTNFSSILGYRIGTYAGGATLGNYNGKLANLRIAVFKAFYTDNFTPVLDNVDTSLAYEDFLIETKLLIQGQTIVDRGPNNYSLTVAGNTSVSEDSAFLPVQTISSLVNPAIKSYGNKGGFALVGTAQHSGAGGGGAGEPGNNSTLSVGGTGGAGKYISAFDSYYAGGGGGGNINDVTDIVAGGLGGGGAGGGSAVVGYHDASPNTGSGAGGSANLSAIIYPGGNGGGGIVKIKYKSAKPIAVKNSDITSNSYIDINLQPVSAQGPSTYSYSINPALPNGLIFNTATGFITGRTTEIIDKNYTVTITDETDVQLRDSNTFRLVVDDITDVNFLPLTTLIEDDKVFNIIKITDSSAITFNKVGTIDYYAIGGGGAGGGGGGTGDACGGGGAGGYIVGRAVLTPDIFTPTIIYADSAFANQGWDTTTDFIGASGLVKFIKTVSAGNNQILQGGARTVELPKTRGYLEIKINEHANVNVGVCKSSSNGGLANVPSINLETGESSSTTLSRFKQNDILQILYDYYDNKVYFGKNNNWNKNYLKFEGDPTSIDVAPVFNRSFYFDGAGDYLTLPSDSGIFNFGTQDFTIEAWVYPTASLSGYKQIAGSSYSTVGGALYLLSDTATFYTTGAVAQTPAGSIVQNTWQHVAAVRTSGTLKIYINGVERSSASLTNNLTTTNAVIGAQTANPSSELFTGYISNLRVVKGTAVYTANFTPITAALTSVTNTSLLTCQNAIVDNSPNNFLIVRSGDVTVSDFSPFTFIIPGGAFQVIVMSNQAEAAESILDAVFLKEQDYVFSAPEGYVSLGGKIATIPVTIGAGGAGVVAIGNNGGDTTLFGQVALGGGGGATFDVAGRAGGNGGGGGGRNTRAGGTGLQLISSIPAGSNGGAAAPTTDVGTNGGGGGGGIPAVTVGFSSQIAFGGETTVIQQGSVFYRVHVFKSTDVFQTKANLSIEYLVVAGGGGGGYGRTGNHVGGGGGAGGVSTGTVSVSSGTTYSISIGGGGAALTSGTNSTIVGGSLNIVTNGGGFGGGGGGANGFPGGISPTPGANGGSGGGGASGQAGGTGIVGQGYNGAFSGSGGGAGGAGASISGSPTVGGTGGIGRQFDITGSATYYAGGGGGPGVTQGQGGLGGGGRGGKDNGTTAAADLATSGTPNTGGGGGGGAPSNSIVGGSGGSGVVIIKYQIPDGEALNNFTYVNVTQFSPGANAGLGTGGAGGNGITLFDGTIYGAGGGSSGQTTSGRGGNATAGDGAINIGLVGAGSGNTNTGSGGGGSWRDTTNGGRGGDGGSGVAFIKYRIR
jgi:sugar lactone lactonase YvrE